MLSISVLGPVELHRDGETIPVRPGKTAEVLIRLALEAGVAVRTELLIEDLWGGEAVATQKNTLQQKVSRLRRDLGDAALVIGGRAGYTLTIDAGAVDALEVLRLAESSSAFLEAGDAESALEVCAAASAMFRGDILCDAGDGEWVVPHRARLEEVRLTLIENELVARMALGAAGQVVGQLEALVARYPLREGLWALLITALYRDGRQADALAAYRRVRARLVDELGVDPGPELQALEQQVLLHDRVLESPTPDRISPTDASPGALPALTSPLVGRDADLTAVIDLVAARPLVTVVGPAGVGKTRLAIEAARVAGTESGTWLVRLETATPTGSLIETIGAALNLHGATEAMVAARFQDRDALLVLDNCEHVIDAVADLVPRLITAAPRLRILATSQLPLGLDGETVSPLEPLAMADSVALFAQRATERRSSFTLDPETTTTVEEVCRSLDGLPLAIELAAARTKVLSVQEIARRLDDRFALLSDPTSRRPERRRTLSAAIAWSYDLLFPDEQRGLWALACFAGGASLDAVENVLEVLDVPKASAVDVVSRLADRSLVAIDVGAEGDVRYRLLDSVRAYAADQLDAAGLTDVARAAHAAWFDAAATVAAEALRGPDQAQHLVFARTERANIDAALEWAGTHDPPLALRVANGYGWAWLMQGEGVVGADRIRGAMHAADAVADASTRAVALGLLGWLQAAGDIERALGDAELAIEIGDTTGDERVAAGSRISKAFVVTQIGPPQEVIRLLDEWRLEYPSMSRSWEAGTSWILTAHASLFLGDIARARACCEAADQVIPALGDDWGLNHLEAILGFLAQAEQRFDDAIAHLTRAAEAARRQGFNATEGFNLSNLGRVLQQAGDDQAAVNTLARAIELGLETGEMRVGSLARVRLGRVLRGMGDRELARSTLQAAYDWYVTSGGGGRALASRDGAALAACLLAAMDAEDGVAGAPDRLEELVDIAREAGDIEIEVLTLDALARCHATAGDAAAVAALLETADGLLPTVAHALSDADRIDARAARALVG